MRSRRVSLGVLFSSIRPRLLSRKQRPPCSAKFPSPGDLSEMPAPHRAEKQGRGDQRPPRSEPASPARAVDGAGRTDPGPWQREEGVTSREKPRSCTGPNDVPPDQSDEDLSPLPLIELFSPLTLPRVLSPIPMEFGICSSSLPPTLAAQKRPRRLRSRAGVASGRRRVDTGAGGGGRAHRGEKPHRPHGTLPSGR